MITVLKKEMKELQDEKTKLEKNIKYIRNEKEIDIKKLKDEKNNKDKETKKIEIEKNNIEKKIEKLISEAKELTNKNDSITREIKNIESEIKTLNDKLKDVQEKQKANQDNIDSIDKVMQTHKDIAEIADMFDTDKDLKEQVIKPNTSANAAVIQDFLRDIHNKPNNLSFELYDGDDKKVTGNKIKNIKLKDGTVVNVEGITINNNGEIVWDNAKVTDAASGKGIDKYPIEFEVEIGAKTIFTGSLQQSSPDRDISITNKKILKVKIDVDYLDLDQRKAEVDAYNNA